MKVRSPRVLLACQGAGGITAVARTVGVSPSAVVRWADVPQEHLEAVSRISDIEPEVLRPDLAEWIRTRRRRAMLTRGRERFAIAAAVAVTGAAELPGEDEMIDLMLTVAAIRFTADRRGLRIGQLLFGRTKPEEAARARAMALAAIVGRASHTTIASVYGCSRQNVDNVTVRYLRARDGDDPDDLVEVDDDGEQLAADGHVIERGRRRVAKAEGDAAILAEQARFAALLDGRGR